MRVLHNLNEMTETARGWLSGGAVGFVPTKGYLHEGHLSLIKEARQACEYCVVSVVAEQSQPYDMERDVQLLEQEQVDVVFAPSREELFPPQFSTLVYPSGPLMERLEAVPDPTMLREYATLMTKLLLLVRPDVAYFGWKHAQKVAIVQQIVRDLNIDVKLQVLPTLHDQDGLAYGSSTGRLAQDERQAALLLSNALQAGNALLQQGERRLSAIEQVMADVLSASPLVSIEYATACLPGTCEHPGELLPDTLQDLLLIVAASIGAFHLTDTLLVTALTM